MKLNTNIAISDSGFIFNPLTGDSFSTNNLGLEIIRLLNDKKEKDAVIKSICEKYEIDETSLDKDLSDFLVVLQNYQLLKDNDQ